MKAYKIEKIEDKIANLKIGIPGKLTTANFSHNFLNNSSKSEFS
jgi:hypothetical protein